MKISVKQAAEIIGSSEQFVRVGLQYKDLPIGSAVQVGGKKRYTYHISPKLLRDYIGDDRFDKYFQRGRW